MAETVQSAELDRDRAMQAYRQTRRRLKQSAEVNARLENGQVVMSQRIQDLSEELAAVRAHAEEFLQSALARQQQEWKRREQEYRNVIHSLKTQIAKTDTMIPLQKYMSAIEASEGVLSVKEELQKQVEELNLKVTKLEGELESTRNTRRQGQQPDYRRLPPTLRIRHSARAPTSLPPEQQPRQSVKAVSQLPKPCPPARQQAANEQMGKESRQKDPFSSRKLPDPPAGGRPVRPTAAKMLVSLTTRKGSDANKGAKTLQVKCGQEATAVIIPTQQHAADQNKPENSCQAVSTSKKPPPPPLRGNSEAVVAEKGGATPKSADRLAIRVSVVRKAGGRKALEEQLRKARSPRPRPVQNHNKH